MFPGHHPEDGGDQQHGPMDPPIDAVPVVTGKLYMRGCQPRKGDGRYREIREIQPPLQQIKLANHAGTGRCHLAQRILDDTAGI